MPMRGTMASSDSTTGWCGAKLLERAADVRTYRSKANCDTCSSVRWRVKGVAYAVVLGWRHGGAEGAVGVDDGARYV